MLQRGGGQLINVNMEVDWQYPMRREMQEILPGLYLGPYSAATKSRVRHKNNQLHLSLKNI